MLSNKFKVLGLFLATLFISGCSKSGTNPIQRGFETFGTSLVKLLSTDNVVAGLMFVAMLFGTFAMFKGLLRFSFKKGFGESTFGNKEINVISLMLSVIGSTGLFYIFKGDGLPVLITYFGGFVGLFLILFLIIFMMGSFVHFANSFKNEEGMLGKGPGWIFIFTLGIILSSYLLLGYIGQILTKLGCNLKNVDAITCSGATNSFNLFIKLYSLIWDLLVFLFPFAVIIGLIWFLATRKKDAENSAPATSSSSDSGDSGWLGKVFGGSKKKEKSDEDKAFEKDVKSLKGQVDVMKTGLNEVIKSLNKQKDLLSKAQMKFSEMDNKGGKN